MPNSLQVSMMTQPGWPPHPSMLNMGNEFYRVENVRFFRYAVVINIDVMGNWIHTYALEYRSEPAHSNEDIRRCRLTDPGLP